MALPINGGLGIGSGVALLFTKKDMLQKGVDFAKRFAKLDGEDCAKPKKDNEKTPNNNVEVKRVVRKRRTKKSQKVE